MAHATLLVVVDSDFSGRDQMIGGERRADDRDRAQADRRPDRDLAPSSISWRPAQVPIESSARLHRSISCCSSRHQSAVPPAPRAAAPARPASQMCALPRSTVVSVPPGGDTIPTVPPPAPCSAARSGAARRVRRPRRRRRREGQLDLPALAARHVDLLVLLGRRARRAAQRQLMTAERQQQDAVRLQLGGVAVDEQRRARGLELHR